MPTDAYTSEAHGHLIKNAKKKL